MSTFQLTLFLAGQTLLSNLCNSEGKMFCSNPFFNTPVALCHSDKKIKSSPVPTPIIAILCFAALQYAYPNQQKLLLVIKEPVSRQTTSCFDMLPVLLLGHTGH